MPEVIIIYRLYYEYSGITESWWEAFSSLPPENYTITRDDAEAAIRAIDDTE